MRSTLDVRRLSHVITSYSIHYTKLYEQDETFGLGIGALDYITKPFHLPVVKARVRNHIRLKLQQDELTKQKKALEKALLEIKTLRGFIPICSHCHQIRDDQGYWQSYNFV